MEKMNLADRMKVYEKVPRIYLERKKPVIIRIDGKAFHTFTRGFRKPFDNCIVRAMQATMMRLCKEIQGCVLGYTQSDEITLVLTDYNTEKSDAWFQYNVQKMTSIAASIATLEFNKVIQKELITASTNGEITSETCYKLSKKEAMFDARAWSLPVDEVNNCLVWRQRDAIRNSIQGLAQANFSHKELHKSNTTQMIEKLQSEKGVDWNDLPIYLQRGTTCIREYVVHKTGLQLLKTEWKLDENIPLFNNNTNYVENLVFVGLLSSKYDINDKVRVKGNDSGIGLIVYTKLERGQFYYSIDTYNGEFECLWWPENSIIKVDVTQETNNER